MDAISLAEGQVKEACNKLERLENMTDLPNRAEEVDSQRQVVSNLRHNLLEMKTTYFILFGALPPLP